MMGRSAAVDCVVDPNAKNEVAVWMNFNCGAEAVA